MLDEQVRLGRPRSERRPQRTEPRRGRGRGRGLPGRGAAGDELRLRPAPLIDARRLGAPPDTVRRPTVRRRRVIARSGRRARHMAVCRLLAPARASACSSSPSAAGWAARGATFQSQTSWGAPSGGIGFIVLYVGLRRRAPAGPPDRQPRQRQRQSPDQADRGREDRARAVRPALRPVPHAGRANAVGKVGPNLDVLKPTEAPGPATRSPTGACRTRRRSSAETAWVRGRCRPDRDRPGRDQSAPSSWPRSPAQRVAVDSGDRILAERGLSGPSAALLGCRARRAEFPPPRTERRKRGTQLLGRIAISA